MRNSLYLIGLAFLIISCGSQKEVAKTQNLPKPVEVKPVVQPKPDIKHEVHGDYFTTNIADPTKNDNTISYGSLVGANPKGYTISRAYFPAVAQNFRQKYVILHYTAIDHDKSVKVLTTQSVSAHYLVNDMDNAEIIITQLDVARNEIERAMFESQVRLILIHGYGKGVLKKELTELLYRYTNLEFYDASLKEYHGDAIEVKFI